MRLKYLCISDTHLGEATSIVSYKEGCRHLAEVIRVHLGDGEKVEVEQLILLGDIPERSHVAPDEMLASTHGFMEALADAVSFEKAIYMPGTTTIRCGPHTARSSTLRTSPDVSPNRGETRS